LRSVPERALPVGGPPRGLVEAAVTEIGVWFSVSGVS
jgi:hypothetical protein